MDASIILLTALIEAGLFLLLTVSRQAEAEASRRAIARHRRRA